MEVLFYEKNESSYFLERGGGGGTEARGETSPTIRKRTASLQSFNALDLSLIAQSGEVATSYTSSMLA